jgi:hypothetical protein
MSLKWYVLVGESDRIGFGNVFVVVDQDKSVISEHVNQLEFERS